MQVCVVVSSSRMLEIHRMTGVAQFYIATISERFLKNQLSGILVYLTVVGEFNQACSGCLCSAHHSDRPTS